MDGGLGKRFLSSNLRGPGNPHAARVRTARALAAWGTQEVGADGILAGAFRGRSGRPTDARTAGGRGRITTKTKGGRTHEQGADSTGPDR